MARDREVRQESALQCLIIGLENLCENEIRNIVNEVKKKIRNEYLKQQYSTVYLEDKIRDSDDNGQRWIDIIRDDKSLDPCDIVSRGK